MQNLNKKLRIEIAPKLMRVDDVGKLSAPGRIRKGGIIKSRVGKACQKSAPMAIFSCYLFAVFLPFYIHSPTGMKVYGGILRSDPIQTKIFCVLFENPYYKPYLIEGR